MIDGQLTLEGAIAAGELGQALAADNAGDGWAAQADTALRRYLESHPSFHVDDFWDWAIPLGLTFEGRAIGARLQAAGRNGWMTKTDRVRPSKRSNGSGKPVWRSLLFPGQEAAA